MARREHPRYENTEWPDYEFVEYPMMVYPGSADGGRTPDPNPKWVHGMDPKRRYLQDSVIVQNEEERRAVLEIEAPAPKDPAFKPSASRMVEAGGGAQRLATEADVKAQLIEEAETLGVEFDRRWGVARLEDAIAEHKAGAGEIA